MSATLNERKVRMSEILAESIENIGFEPRSYSGRAMYGKECIGFTVDDSPLAHLVALTIDVAEIAYEAEEDEAFELLEYMKNVSTDSMGLGTIIYFSSLPYVEEGDE